MRSWHIRTLTLASALMLAAAASTGGLHAQRSTPAPALRPSTSPSEVVERFMQLASAKNYGQMGYAFGTREGAILSREPQPSVERRMYAIAQILQNDRYVIRDQSPIPGRNETDAVQLTVQVTQGGQAKSVPFVAVRTTHGNWLVEQIDLERLTRSF
ncbi:MAG TPA: hypothetical protein VFJ16_03075 [Longimicrobium sp.]|nr:hypothetical protein [Longimicrobium sp.]